MIQLRPGQTLQDGAGDLLPGTPDNGYSTPCVADWNGDGRKDLLVGYQATTAGGKIALYLNQGNDEAPVFAGFSRLKTGTGKDIQHSSSGCGAPAPWVCDFDSDGKRDLLVGAGADGSIFFYRNTNSDVAPILDVGRKLDIGGTLLTVGIRATPFYYDLDRDGLKDLVVGAGDGLVYYFRNTNSAQDPLFAPATKLQAGGNNLFLGIRSVVRAFDWDGDGADDLICSSDTGVYWCRRQTDGSFAAPEVLKAPDTATETLVPVAPVSVPNGRLRIDISDWNNDGVMDLLVGNTAGTVCLYEGYQFRITSVVKRGSDLELRWNSAPALRYNLLFCNDGPSAGCPAYSNIVSGGNVTCWTNHMKGDSHLFRLQISE